MNSLEKRVIEISYHHKLTHVSSCLNTVNVLNWIYKARKDDDPVVLGNSHAALALYVVLEAFGHCEAEKMVEKHGVHAGRDMEHGIWCSGGSLGQCEPIAVGMAIADRNRTVWLITSDGALAEGATWEAFNLAYDQKLTNLQVHVIANGFGAYRVIDRGRLFRQLSVFLPPNSFIVHQPEMPFPWLKGLQGHYLVLSPNQYEECILT